MPNMLLFFLSSKMAAPKFISSNKNFLKMLTDMTAVALLSNKIVSNDIKENI